MTETWRLLPFHVGSSAEHFRSSDALVRLVERPTLWWHATRTPTLILGAGQRGTSREALPFQAVKRQTGGTSVLATADVIGLDAALPKGHPLVSDDVVESYRWFGETWAAAMRSLGADVHLVTIAEARGELPPPTELTAAVKEACFGTLSPYEVAAGPRKLVGLAQVRRQKGLLLQAGLHLSFDADSLARILVADNADELAAELRTRAVGLHELTSPGVGFADVMHAFAETLRQRYDVRLEPGDWTAAELAHAGG